MQIERNHKNQITITLSGNVSETELQSLIDYVRYLEISVSNAIKQPEADKLADEVNNEWWEKNKEKFIQ